MGNSVALVVLDTLRKDAFDEHFGWLDGFSFRNAYSPSHWTIPVHAAIFTGMYPTEVNVHASHPSLDSPRPTLAEKLRRSGWTCRGYSANGNVSPSTNFDRGFDDFEAKGYHSEYDIFDWQEFISENSDSGWTRYIRAIEECFRSDSDTIPSLRRGVRMKYDDFRHGGPPDLTVEDALNYVETEVFGDQEFLFMNLMEAHPSYFPPPEYRTVEPLFVNSIDALATVLRPEEEEVDVNRFRQTYEDSVRYLSEHYREIHDILENEFDYVITVSDHGESFGTDGIYAHIPSLVPQIVHVPLVISGDVPVDSSSATVSSLDIHQTIASITDIEDPPRGQDLLDPDPGVYLSEAHGVSKWQRRGLKQRGISDERLDPVEQIRRGVAVDDYYGYESIFDGWVHSSGRHPDPQEAVERVVATFEDESSSDGQEISRDVQEQLRNMGYL